ASSIVWFDALVTNVDRTPRNTNLLVWHRKLYLIDHGASLYFHHNWDGSLDRSAGARRDPGADPRDVAGGDAASRISRLVDRAIAIAARMGRGGGSCASP